jgi:hypothetical protein
MQMTKATDMTRNNTLQEIQLTQEEKLISMMNSHKVRLAQFEPASIQIRM